MLVGSLALIGLACGGVKDRMPGAEVHISGPEPNGDDADSIDPMSVVPSLDDVTSLRAELQALRDGMALLQEQLERERSENR